jgi:hypothetical protein
VTLTISAFNPEAEDSNSTFKVAGDYSAVFPLLVVSVFVSLMFSRDTVFYATQRSRGDINAVPEVLCQPGQEGAPLVVGYDNYGNECVQSFSDSFEDFDSDVELALSQRSRDFRDGSEANLVREEIDRDFEKTLAANNLRPSMPHVERRALQTAQIGTPVSSNNIFEQSSTDASPLSSLRLNELLGMDSATLEPVKFDEPKTHRRTQSAPMVPKHLKQRSRSNSKERSAPEALPPIPPPSPRSRPKSSSGQQGSLMHVSSFGHIDSHQPSLLEQARMRSASTVSDSRHRRIPSGASSIGDPPVSMGHQRTSSLPKSPEGRAPSGGLHSRKNSFSKQETATDNGSALSLTVNDVESSYFSTVEEPVIRSAAPSSDHSSPWSNN